MPDAEAQLDTFIAKFAPPMQVLIRSVRAALQARFPTACELVWDNYNFFVIGYCASERPSSAILSMAADANGIVLSFYRGTDLDDPDGLLLGQGAQNRFIRVVDADILARPDVAAMIDQATRRAAVPLREAGESTLIIRSISAKQRPRRSD